MFDLALAILVIATAWLAFDAGRSFEARPRGSRLGNNAADVALGKAQRRRERRVEWTAR